MTGRKKTDRSRRGFQRTAFAAGGAVVVAGLFHLVQANIDLLIEWQISQKISESAAAQEISDSRLEVIFCGTGTPSLNPHRGQPCLGVIAGGRLLMFDAGQGSARRLSAVAAPLERLETIFLTHLHSDHVSGLGEMLHNGWLFGLQERVEVVGPPGTARLLQGYQEVYAADIEMRRGGVEAKNNDAHSGLARAKEVQIDTEEAVTVYDKDGIIVQAFRVIHPDWAYAYGYRIETRGKTIVVSGDTRYTPAIARHGKGADLLIHEALNVKMMSIASQVMEEQSAAFVSSDRMKKINDRHTPTDQVAQAAAEADVKTLVLTHLTPSIPASSVVEYFFTRGMDEIFEGEILVARDGMRLTLID